MVEFGYALSAEEHSPNELVKNARRAEEVGFTFALISDHYHPWVSAQGNAPFVWSVIGGIAQATQKLRLGTGVTCPILRIHPAVLAQAAATSAAMMPGRFFFGVGTGEALNEHILGEHWPIFDERLDMLVEAVEVMRMLWEGKETSFWGEYYTVENAQLFTLPDQPIPLYIAASGVQAAEEAGRTGDGWITTSPDDKELFKAFEDGGGKDKPKIAQVKVCWAESEDKALDIMWEKWPTSNVPGPLHSDLPTPAHFEAAAKMGKKEDIRGTLPLGPDPKVHLKALQEAIDAGFDQVYVHQVGPDQEGFFDFYQRKILPELR